MNSKTNSLSYQLRLQDKRLKLRSQEIYDRWLIAILKDQPESMSAGVASQCIIDGNYAGLLSWSDSLGSAVHGSVTDSFVASQLVALIKKYPFPIPEFKKLAREEATRKFLAAENRCKKYNLKFRLLTGRRWNRHESTHFRMASWIRHVIGDSPVMHRIYSKCAFGPGASIGIHGNETSLARKFLAKDWSCTPGALPYARSALAQDFHVWELLNSRRDRPVCLDFEDFCKRVDEKVRLVHNNNIVFVPKTTMVDRTIAVEPLLNGYLQKGIDLELRDRLKRVSIDLSDQGRNQELARLGSLPAEPDPYVTIDLSSASDSISTEVVRRLLPPDWFDLLNSSRCHTYILEKTEHRYEKFVSMGNGFCFPLETLIFASVCAIYSKPGDFTVYGDDIIVRQSVASQVIKTLWQLGFRHNTGKTFLQGPFRESCGADWYAGRDVRPLTLDYAFDSVENVIKFYNMSKRKPFWDSFFSPHREMLRELIPRSLQFQRPFYGVETGAFEVPFDVFISSPFAKYNRKICTWSWLEICRKACPDVKGISSDLRYSTV